MDSTPRVNWRLAIASAAFLTLIFAINPFNGDGDFLDALVRQVIVWGLWVALSPLVLRVARRRPLEERPTADWVRAQILPALGFCLLHAVLNASIRTMLGIALFSNIFQAVAANFAGSLGRNFITYGMIVAAYHAWSYHNAVRERDQRAARLELDLTEAKLDNLEGRLRPHFLFNTLNTIAALIREDPRTAEVLIGKLSDLLRASLRADPSREVPLESELELVQHYLEIERTRFQDRLSITVMATSDARQGLVPHLILQPLVENAVRHGIAPRDAAGHIGVTAEQSNGWLRIVVEDDGVGMGNAPENLAGSGIGLGGVRSRLSYLYGANQKVEVTACAPSGTRVTVELPYKAAS